MTAPLSELMRNTLDDLTGAEFKRFRHFLRDDSKIPWGKLEKSDTDDAVDLMVQVHSMEAGSVMVNILRKMNNNHLARDLEDNLGRLAKKQDGSGSSKWMPYGASHGAPAVLVNATANSGGRINAPAITGCTFSGNVNFGDNWEKH